jgi:hypothetical protein
MEYHLQLFDIRTLLRWVYRTGDHQELRNKPPGNLKEILRVQEVGNAGLVKGVMEVRRKVLRFDNDTGVAVYHVRLSSVRSFAMLWCFFIQPSD